MKKKIFLTAVCALALNPSFAQDSYTNEETVEYSTDKYKVETNHFWDNWFVSVGGGAQIYFGDHDKQCGFGDRLAPALDIAVGKWFTPGIGVRLMYSGLQVKGATQKGALAHSTGEDVPGKGGTGYWLEKQKFDFGNFHVDVLFNLTNLFGGYKERVWNISPYLGVGYAHVYKSPNAKEVSANVGLLNTFRLCSALDINLDVRGMFVNDRFDGEGGGRFGEGNLSATIGLTYKFKQRGWNRSKTIIRHEYDNDAINAMRRQIDEMSAENARLRQAISDGNKTEERVIVKKMASPNLVIFKLNKSNLSNEARANLGLLAEVIKSGDSDVVYTITGYADNGTGNTAVNERLSRERAQAVYDCLVDEFGVSRKQLDIDYKGGVENMFYDDPRLSRAVITRSE